MNGSNRLPDDVAILVTDSPSNGDVTAVSEALDAFNIDLTGIEDRRSLAVLIRDEATGKTIGGITGKTSMAVWFVDLFYVPPALRGSGLGSRLLGQAEEEAIRRGCTTGFLYTISFQAPQFYERHGWTEFGRIPCEPAGSSRIFMSKDLAPLG
ncbi:GNAT superfamily N-acetyltransferase [Microbacterium resistens]|uniref:GNAT superfamily N-acetyltransferase n=1 Tax=Microbacterium resistens TaxID=156977 RepID=A0ABU1SF68_9MICO|nr:GNAT family N-acetyltransferase [Microbacterium resistens]MDR6868258.1 GNAT superfamily N-acetyltransferase [Microbacterium resistens]